MRWPFSFALRAAVLALPFVVHAGTEPDPRALMPQAADHTQMWWADGFPGHTPAAPWRRVIQTGRYTLALDTDTMRIPHYGLVACGDWRQLPPADLALSLAIDGKTYRCTAGGKWTALTGPRLVESGRWLQRADVTDLAFTADDGTRLNVDARFETVAWPDRLALILAAKPGLLPIQPGEASFGRVGGGFGLDGSNHLEVAHSPELEPEQFTLELWAFVPADHQPSKQTHPWLVCKNAHEAADGNYGIVLLGGHAQARMNIGGGRDGQFAAGDRAKNALKIEAWNHLAMSYDGDMLRLFVNGEPAGETKVGRKRVPGRGGLAFGRRQDNCGDGFHFRGVIDEIRLYDRALTAAEIRARQRKPDTELAATRSWSFDAKGTASMTKPGATWTNAAMEIDFTAGGAPMRAQWAIGTGEVWTSRDWKQVCLVPHAGASAAVTVQATERKTGVARPVTVDADRGWHCVNLDGIEPIVPPGTNRENDAMERVKLVLTNTSDREQLARLLFEKSAHGIRRRIGAAITGVSAILRGGQGNPTGIPVQLSKNWHNDARGGAYAGQWFHGFSQVRVPAGSTVELELTLVYGHWGGVAAASHAQLCLIGWGSNQLWDQSALGSWGESICYEPDQAQAAASILDVRPVMVKSMSGDRPFNWTHNVGGGDFFRLFDAAGKRVFPAGMRTTYLRQGPCLTEVTYAGRTGDALEHSATVSLARTDDLVRGLYRIRLDVKAALPFSRLVLFQIGADTYSYAAERKFAVGDEGGLLREWNTQWGGDIYRTEPIVCAGRVPWVSLHEGVRSKGDVTAGAWANRGVVIRAWDAKLGGRRVLPCVAERGVDARGAKTSTLDLVPPAGVTQLEPGDYVEATLAHLVVPQAAGDYHGPNESLRAALKESGNTWRMIHREATGDDRKVAVRKGKLERLYPDVRFACDDDRAEFTLTGGLGYVPVTFTGLTSPRVPVLRVDGHPFDQSVHGRDFWQTDYDAATKAWSMTFNVPAGSRAIEFKMENP